MPYLPASRRVDIVYTTAVTVASDARIAGSEVNTIKELRRLAELLLVLSEAIGREASAWGRVTMALVAGLVAATERVQAPAGPRSRRSRLEPASDPLAP